MLFLKYIYIQCCALFRHRAFYSAELEEKNKHALPIPHPTARENQVEDEETTTTAFEVLAASGGSFLGLQVTFWRLHGCLGEYLWAWRCHFGGSVGPFRRPFWGPWAPSRQKGPPKEEFAAK